jgi:UDP-N-acetylmuramoyl-tripeptide--D-alanyl-D-alanine ligase
LGEAGALATAAAVCVVEALLDAPVDPAIATRALARVSEAADGRLAIVPLADGTLLIDDSYNANPASMRASIAAAAELARCEERGLVLVLGEMRELGPLALAEHEAVGEVASGSGASVVIGVGAEAARIVERARRAGMTAELASDSRQAGELAVLRAKPGDVVLVKGSRGVATERVVEALLRRSPPRAERAS